jgi:hypothetical protein
VSVVVKESIFISGFDETLAETLSETITATGRKRGLVMMYLKVDRKESTPCLQTPILC